MAKSGDLKIQIYSKMYPVSCTNTHHEVRDLVNHGIVSKNLNILRTKQIKKIKKYKIKKLLICASDNTF